MGKTHVVFIGREPGIYATWEECQAQVSGYSCASHRSFEKREDAEKQFATFCQGTSGFLCPCGAGRVTLSCSNTTNRPGRYFFHCPASACGYVVWASDIKMCRCGKGRCRIMTSTNVESNGRQFYCCPMTPSCGYRSWVENDEGSTSASSPTSSLGGGNQAVRNLLHTTIQERDDAQKELDMYKEFYLRFGASLKLEES